MSQRIRELVGKVLPAAPATEPEAAENKQEKSPPLSTRLLPSYTPYR